VGRILCLSGGDLHREHLRLKPEYIVIGAAVLLYLWNQNKKTGCQCGGH
jgi:hypothetical protein